MEVQAHPVLCQFLYRNTIDNFCLQKVFLSISAMLREMYINIAKFQCKYLNNLKPVLYIH